MSVCVRGCVQIDCPSEDNSNLNMFHYKWTNEFIVESFESITDMVVSRFAHNIFDTSH